MSQFAPEDSQGTIDLVSNGDITFEADRDQDGAGDLVFRTGGVERARIKHDGSGTGWPNVLGGSVSSVNDVTISADTGDTGSGDIVFNVGGAEYGRIGASGAAYFDSLGLFTDHDAYFSIRYRQLAPTDGHVFPAYFSYVDGLGNSGGNVFKGVSGASFTAADAPGVTASTKGVLYGAELQVTPSLIRNNSPYDDATGLIITNNGSAMATDCIYIAHGVSGGGTDWDSVFTVEAHANELIKTTTTSVFGYGVKLDKATVSSAILTGPNNVPIQMADSGGTLKSITKLNASNVLELYGAAATLDSTGKLTASALASPAAAGWTGEPLGNVERYLMPTGTLITSLDPGNAAIAASLGLLTSGTTRLVRGGFSVGQKVTNFNFVTGTQAAVTPTHWWGVILDTSGNVLAVTADQTTTAIGASSLVSVAFSAATVIPAGPFYYGLMVAASTVPTLAGLGSLFNAVTSGFPVRGGNSTTTGSTTAPAVAGTIAVPTTESSSRPWFFLT